jgi:hypothetical protein
VLTLIIENIEIFKLASWILPKIQYMKYGALIGVVLVIVDFLMDKAEKKVLSIEVNKIQNELNAVKAQLFDIQKPTPPASASPTGSSEETQISSKDD